MGEINFLKGGYQGKVGQTYGVMQRQNAIVKAIPFSHAPHNTKQKEQFSAFGALQRACAQITREFWPYLGLTNKNQLRLNATTHFFKPLIKDKVLDFTNLKDIVTPSGLLTIDSIKFNRPRQTFELTYTNAKAVDASRQPFLLIGIYGVGGKGYGTIINNASNATVAVPTKYKQLEGIYAVILQSEIDNEKRKITDYAIADLSELPFVEEKWLPNNMQNGNWYFRDPEQLIGENVIGQFDGERLTIS